MVALLVEVSHTDLSEVTWMVLVHVGSVVMLSTSKTTTTGMLAVFSYTTVSGGDVSAAIESSSACITISVPIPIRICEAFVVFEIEIQSCPSSTALNSVRFQRAYIQRSEWKRTYCLRVLLKWVGIFAVLSMSLNGRRWIFKVQVDWKISR